MYFNGFLLNTDYVGTTKLICFLQWLTGCGLVAYECHQVALQKIRYFRTITNWIDMLSITAIISSSFILGYNATMQESDIKGTHVPYVTSIYAICLLLTFLKLYKNLECLDEFRHLSYSLFKILEDIRIYMFLFGIFILCFGLIFYVTKFFDNK
jgi:hypothetical protein